MYGNKYIRSLRGIFWMIRRPMDILPWLKQRIYPVSPIDLELPWFSWAAIEYLDSLNINSTCNIFEWGAGGSTIYFANKKANIVTVESNSYWKKHVEEILKRKIISNVTIRYIPAESQKSEDLYEYIKAVNKGKPWNIIVVDGLEKVYLSRVACIEEASKCMKCNGCIILDDAWRAEYKNVPEILKGWKRRCFKSLGPYRLGVTQTDVYIRQ